MSHVWRPRYQKICEIIIVFKCIGFPPFHKKQISHRNQQSLEQSNVTWVVDVQVVGMYIKVGCDGREGNLQSMLLLECDGTYRSEDCWTQR